MVYSTFLFNFLPNNEFIAIRFYFAFENVIAALLMDFRLVYCLIFLNGHFTGKPHNPALNTGNRVKSKIGLRFVSRIS